MSSFEPDIFEERGDADWGPVAGLEEAAWVSCPYCGESVELLLDPSGGSSQEYVEDCEICCRPWGVYIALDRAGHADVTVVALD